jgi:hypothetical protein
MKNDKNTFVREHTDTEVSREDATEQFIKHMEETLKNLRDNKHGFRAGLIALSMETRAEDLNDPTMDPETRQNLLNNLDQAGNEVIIGAGPPARVMELVSRMPEMIADDLVEEHKHECDSDDCVMHNPTVAPYLGTLKAMAMVLARTSAAGNVDATRLLYKSLKEMGRKALDLAKLKQTQDTFMEDSSLVAISGEKAKGFVRLLVESGMLPPELSEKLAKKLEEEDNENTNPPEEMSKDCTFVPNGTSTKH